MTELRRVGWRHRDSGRISIGGVGQISNFKLMPDVEDLNEQIPDLEFWVEEYDADADVWIPLIPIESEA